MTPDHKQKIAELARKFAWELADAPDTSDYHARGWNSANAGFQAGAEAYAALRARDAAEIELLKKYNGISKEGWLLERQARADAEARVLALEDALKGLVHIVKLDSTARISWARSIEHVEKLLREA